MCRNIRPLYNFEPPANHEEIESAARQFVRKVSGMTSPSGTNQTACDEAVRDIVSIVEEMFSRLSTSAKPRNREVEAAKARERSARRFAVPAG